MVSILFYLLSSKKVAPSLIKVEDDKLFKIVCKGYQKFRADFKKLPLVSRTNKFLCKYLKFEISPTLLFFNTLHGQFQIIFLKLL
jgi:hypothetical protein